MILKANFIIDSLEQPFLFRLVHSLREFYSSTINFSLFKIEDSDEFGDDYSSFDEFDDDSTEDKGVYGSYDEFEAEVDEFNDDDDIKDFDEEEEELSEDEDIRDLYDEEFIDREYDKDFEKNFYDDDYGNDYKNELDEYEDGFLNIIDEDSYAGGDDFDS